MSQIYEFEPFRLNVRAGRLTRANQEIHLTAKGYATLLFLVERAGSLVSKEELLAHLWPEGFVEPANLTQTVYVLRKKLDDADALIIKTEPGRGYRFAAPVRAIARQARRPSSPRWVDRRSCRCRARDRSGTSRT